ncbi:MAG: zinc-binding dehydrogenase [Anaerolineae bacterium]
MLLSTFLTFDAPFAVSVQTEPLPAPGPGEVLVRTAVSAISPGTEMLLYRGQFPADLPVDETIPGMEQGVRYPLRYGYAAVGQVIGLGDGVAAAWHGRTVFAFHPHQSHFTARPEQLHPLPDGMEPETAVFLPNMETAVSFVMDGRPVIGERVVVWGQGIVGLLTTAVLAQFPLASLITVDAHPLRREWSRRLGATASLPPGDAASLRRHLPDGADLSLELSGNPAALDQAVEFTGDNGRLLIGSWYGEKRANLNLGGRFHRSQMQIIASQVSRLHPRWHGRWTKTRRLQLAWQMLAQIHPEQLITHRVPLAQAPAAYQLLHDSPATAVQILLTYPD